MSHLDTFIHTFTHHSNPNMPPEKYVVRIIFGHHCFTRQLKPSDPQDLCYPEPSFDQRAFDFDRYELSKQLPQIVQNLMGQKCSHTGHGTYFIVKLTDQRGVEVEYEVYFDVNKIQGSKTLELKVHSAYVRDTHLASNRPKFRPVRFEAILRGARIGKKPTP